jgi:antitoxin ParD1/3/4
MLAQQTMKLEISESRDNLPSMEDLHIPLSENQQAFVDEQVAVGDYESPADYVAALILAEQRAQAQARLEALLLEGLEGEATEWTEADSLELMRLAREGD